MTMKMTIGILGVVLLGLGHTPARAEDCPVGKNLLLDEGIRLAIEINNDKADISTQVKVARAKMSPEDRRLTAAWEQSLRLQLYGAASPNKTRHPETTRAAIGGVRQSCKGGDSLVIPHPEYNRVAIAELCDFGKAIVTTPSSVICIVRQH